MADDIRIKDLQSTASYMESDDYLPIDGLALGNRKIPFTGLMDSEDDRLPTTDKTPRGAITEHEGDISEIKQSLSNLNIEELWTGSKYTTGDIQLSKATKTNDVLILSFRGFSASMTQQFPILIQSGVSNYQVSYWGDASQFGRYRLVITNNSTTFTINDVTNGSANSALIGIYRVRTS